MATAAPRFAGGAKRDGEGIALLLAGDVMTGRGIDQILEHPGDPALYESYMRSALGYVELAEERAESLPRRVAPGYIWGDALGVLEQFRPQARIVNLETAVTRTGAPWPRKAVHYRMDPANVTCLVAAGIDCCVLANNHALDWGHAGLIETLETLERAGLGPTGAGRDAAAAAAPTELPLRDGGRVLVFALGEPGSGIPRAWAAGERSPGIRLVDEVSERTAAAIATEVAAARRPGDIVIASIHWGGNWGYRIPPAHRRFAHRLIDEGGADLIHGHSSHHPLGLEVYRERLILYGCGDLINDYEGIGGHEAYRPQLTALYLPALAASGALRSLTLIPLEIARFRLSRARDEDAAWLMRRLDRESRKLGAGVALDERGNLTLDWQRSKPR